MNYELIVAITSVLSKNLILPSKNVCKYFKIIHMYMYASTYSLTLFQLNQTVRIYSEHWHVGFWMCNGQSVVETDIILTVWLFLLRTLIDAKIETHLIPKNFCDRPGYFTWLCVYFVKFLDTSLVYGIPMPFLHQPDSTKRYR